MSRTELLDEIAQELEYIPDAMLPQVLQAIHLLKTKVAEQQVSDLAKIFAEDASLLSRLAQ